MGSIKIVGVALLVAGVLALVYRGFSYTKESEKAKIGNLELVAKDTERVNIPIWAGVGAIVLGGGLLLVGGKKA
jgi:hypothetical protein